MILCREWTSDGTLNKAVCNFFSLISFHSLYSADYTLNVQREAIMLVHLSFCLILLTATYLHPALGKSLSSADIDEQQEKALSNALMLERFDVGSGHLSSGRQYDDEIIDDEEYPHEKRQLKRKWNKFHAGARSPYTIAFPALIRTRRSIE